jgi:hypothetical protein
MAWVAAKGAGAHERLEAAAFKGTEPLAGLARHARPGKARRQRLDELDGGEELGYMRNNNRWKRKPTRIYIDGN